MTLPHRHIKHRIDTAHRDAEKPRGPDPHRERIRRILADFLEPAVLRHDVPVLLPIDAESVIGGDGDVIHHHPAPVFAVERPDPG